MIGLMLTLIVLGYFANSCVALSGADAKCNL
jgi:hypothetical protein